MAETTDQLEHEVHACRNQLDARLDQLQARVEETRDEAKERIRRVSWVMLVAGAAACGFSLLRLAKRRRSASRWAAVRGALLDPRKRI